MGFTDLPHYFLENILLHLRSDKNYPTSSEVGLSIYLLILRIDKGGNFFTRENHFTEGNWDWFGENNIPSVARDVIFPKPVEIPQGKVIFPGKKITTLVNPQNE